MQLILIVSDEGSRKGFGTFMTPSCYPQPYLVAVDRKERPTVMEKIILTTVQLGYCTVSEIREQTGFTIEAIIAAFMQPSLSGSYFLRRNRTVYRRSAYQIIVR